MGNFNTAASLQPQAQTLMSASERLQDRLLEALGRLHKISTTLLGHKPEDAGVTQPNPNPMPSLARYLEGHHSILADIEIELSRLEAQI